MKKKVFNDVLKEFPTFLKVIDYCDMYLRGDVLQLEDIIEIVKNIFFKTHKLDLLRYYGAPGYSWDAFLLHVKQRSSYKPELFIYIENE